MVDVPEFHPVDVLALEEDRLPRIRDLHLLEHLANDHTDVFVVDLHTLESVDLLDLVEQIFLDGSRAPDLQNIVRIDRSLGESIARTHAVTFVDSHVFDDGHHVGPLVLLARVRRNDNFAFAALDVAKADFTVDLRDNRGILRPASLEQLGHARQPTRDIPSLVDLPADLGNGVTGGDLVPIMDRESGSHRHDELT